MDHFHSKSIPWTWAKKQRKVSHNATFFTNVRTHERKLLQKRETPIITLLVVCRLLWSVLVTLYRGATLAGRRWELAWLFNFVGTSCNVLVRTKVMTSKGELLMIMKHHLQQTTLWFFGETMWKRVKRTSMW